MYSLTVTSKITNLNVTVVVLAPDQRHIHSNYASRYSHALGGVHIGVGLLLTLATVSLVVEGLPRSNVLGRYGGSNFFLRKHF